MRPWTAALACLPALALGAPEPGGLEEALVLQGAKAVEDEMARLTAQVRPSSVTVFNLVKRGAAFVPQGGGSGVVIKAGGLVLTNEHVVAGADRLEVVPLDGKRYEALLQSRVPGYDLALLQVLDAKGKPLKGLKPAVQGRSTGFPPGRWVLATGNPFLLAPSGRAVATLGVLSGSGRVAGGEYLYGSAIQHDAEINPGNSGGPLWDLDGRLLGINGRISARAFGSPCSSGVGYTIPIDQIRNFLPGLLEGGADDVAPGDLGVLVETAKDAKGAECGARVSQVKAGSAAEKAKLRPGDVIESITLKSRAYPVQNATDFVNVISNWPEGTRVDAVRLRRDGKAQSLTGIVLGPAKP